MVEFYKLLNNNHKDRVHDVLTFSLLIKCPRDYKNILWRLIRV
jgi:hypothetical protein